MRTANPMGIFLSSQFAAISASQDFIGFPYEFPVETPRNFTTLSAAGSMYFQFIDDLVFPSAFEHEFKVQTNTSGTLKTILGDNPTAHNIVIRTDGKISITGATTVIFNTDVTDGQLHTFKITRVGTAIEGFLDGVSDGTGTIAGDITFSRLGASLADFFDGVIADVKLLGGEINGVPTPVLYTIDEDWVSSTNLNNNATIGGLGDATATNITADESEPFDFDIDRWVGTISSVINGTFDTDTNWSKGTGTTISGGVANFVNGGVNAIFQNNVISSSVRIAADVVSTSGGIEAHPGGDLPSVDFRGTGSQTWDLIPITPNGALVFDGDSFTGTLDNVTAVRILEVAP